MGLKPRSRPTRYIFNTKPHYFKEIYLVSYTTFTFSVYAHLLSYLLADIYAINSTGSFEFVYLVYRG